MKIARIDAHWLRNIPIQPPPFRSEPSTESALLFEVETDDGLIGWSMAGYANQLIVEFVKHQAAPFLMGEDPLRTELIHRKLRKSFKINHMGAFLTSAISVIDIALWDLKGKALGKPVHHLLGGARDSVPVYITHGAAYGGVSRYEVDELAAEAKYLVKLGNRFLKNTVARQDVADPEDDAIRMRAIREAVGPEIRLAMDGNYLMSAPQAVELCQRTQELHIAFLEEPALENDPLVSAEIRRKTTIPIAAAQNWKYDARDFLLADAVDILQPNVANDGGVTGALNVAALAKAFRVPIGHGNGSGPHNIALQCGLAEGQIVEYHFHKWMAYNAIFAHVPQPGKWHAAPD